MSNRPQDTDIDFIGALAEMLRQNELSEIEVQREYGENDAITVRVARQMAPVPVVPQPASALSAPMQSSGPAPKVSDDPADDPGVVASPMVGTAYLQGDPETPPFVKIGDTVTEGQTILIIEAMKTMNQIPAPRDGRVKRILVEDGSPIEFGAPLIILE